MDPRSSIPQVNTGLSSLNLSYNEIRNTEASLLAEALKTNSALRVKRDAGFLSARTMPEERRAASLLNVRGYAS